MHSIFGIDPADVLHISAKTGEGISDVLRAIVERIPPPSGEITGKFKAFLFDSSSVPFFFGIGGCPLHSRRYDRYRGVISLVSIQDGALRKGAFVLAIRWDMSCILRRG
jgi:translation elongation factor EF-4